MDTVTLVVILVVNRHLPIFYSHLLTTFIIYCLEHGFNFVSVNGLFDFGFPSEML